MYVEFITLKTKEHFYENADSIELFCEKFFSLFFMLLLVHLEYRVVKMNSFLFSTWYTVAF